MPRQPNLVKNQHYVWRKYLEAWAPSGNLFCWLHSKKKIISIKPEGIAVGRFFYGTTRLSEGDRQYLEGIISEFKIPEVQELNRNFYNLFEYSYKLRSIFDADDVSEKLRIDLKEELQRAERMMGELYHQALENKSQPFLAQLRERDASFFEYPALCGQFLHFFCNQYFRTSALRNRMSSNRPLIADHDPARTWLIESFMYATSVSASIMMQRSEYRIVFLNNSTGVPFITGDQPIINLAGHLNRELDMYYPVSPRVAAWLVHDPHKQRSPIKEASLFEVERYNHLIFERSYDQIYSDDRVYLHAITSIGKSLVD